MPWMWMMDMDVVDADGGGANERKEKRRKKGAYWGGWRLPSTWVDAMVLGTNDVGCGWWSPGMNEYKEEEKKENLLVTMVLTFDVS